MQLPLATVTLPARTPRRLRLLGSALQLPYRLRLQAAMPAKGEALDSVLGRVDGHCSCMPACRGALRLPCRLRLQAASLQG